MGPEHRPASEDRADSPAAELGADKKPFHLARLPIEVPKGDAAGDALTHLREEERAARWGVLSRQRLEFASEVLEIEGKVEAPRILLEELASDRDALRVDHGPENDFLRARHRADQGSSSHVALPLATSGSEPAPLPRNSVDQEPISGRSVSACVPSRRVLDWLLDEREPAARYLALRDLLGTPADDSEVRSTRAQIPRRGWVAAILAARRPDGSWVDPERLYTPKYRSTNWMMLVLSDLGLSKSVPWVRESCEFWMARSTATDGGFSISGAGKSHHCYVGNMTRALIRFGYDDDPRVRSALDWLVRTAHPRGGWSCFGGGRNLDSWEGLSAFAAYPRAKWTASMTDCIDRAAEFFLERELHRQGSPYAPWSRFHYPVHYYYDLLVGLDLLTALGHAGDPRLRFALSVLHRRRRPDGRWNLDALHPDVEGSLEEWFRAHPGRRPEPFGLETVGRPSKLLTLAAERVLARVEGTA